MRLNKIAQKEKKKKKIKNIFIDILLVISIFVFIFSAFRTAQILLEYKRDADKYEQMADEFVEKVEIPTNKNEINTESTEDTEDNVLEDDTEPEGTRAALKVDFDVTFYANFFNPLNNFYTKIRISSFSSLNFFNELFYARC